MNKKVINLTIAPFNFIHTLCSRVSHILCAFSYHKCALAWVHRLFPFVRSQFSGIPRKQFMCNKHVALMSVRTLRNAPLVSIGLIVKFDLSPWKHQFRFNLKRIYVEVYFADCRFETHNQHTSPTSYVKMTIQLIIPKQNAVQFKYML